MSWILLVYSRRFLKKRCGCNLTTAPAWPDVPGVGSWSGPAGWLGANAAAGAMESLLPEVIGEVRIRV